MSEMTFLINDTSTSGNTPVVRVRIAQNTDGTVSFLVTQLAGYVGDLRGLFFDVADELLIGTLTAWGVGLTELQQGNDSVVDLGGGANLNGLVGDNGGYDVGVEIGSSGIKIADDIRSFSFTLDSSLRDLTIADFSSVHFGARVTSVGLDSNLDGSFETSRNLSSKTGELTFSVITPTKDSHSVAEDAATSGNVLANDGGTAADVLTVTGWSGGDLGVEYAFAELAYSKIRLNADGSYTIDASAADSLAAGESVSHNFTYTVLQTNVDGTSTHVVSFRVTITGTNDAPIIVGETFNGSVEELGSNADVGTLSSNGSISFDDADLTDGHTVAFSPIGTTLGTLSALAVSDAATGAGDGTIAWTYSVAADAVAYLAAGEARVEEFTVTVSDDDGTPLSDSATVRVTVTGTNDAPVIVGEATNGSVEELGSNADVGTLSTNGSISFGDADLTDGHTVTFSPIGTTLGTLSALAVSDTATGAGDGTITWTYSVAAGAVAHLAAGETRVEEFTVTVSDDDGMPLSDSVTVRITVTGTNDTPMVAASDVTGEVLELLVAAGNLSDSGTIAFSDADLADTHSIQPTIAASAGALGALTASVSTQASDVDGAGGAITWHYNVAADALEYLEEGQTKVETFTITLDDGNGGTVARTISVTLVGTADGTPPVANNDTLAAVEDTTVTYTAAQLLGNDTDAENDMLTIASVTSGTGGTALLNANGTVTFTPNANFNGAASFTYAATDGTHTSNAAAVTVNVAAVNDAPVANDDTFAAVEDTPITYTAAQLLGNDSDIDTPSGQLQIASVTSGTGGTAVLNGNGTVTFTPGANFNGSATFSYRASDGNQLSNSANVVVNVTPVNDAPGATQSIAPQSTLLAQPFSFALPAGLFVDPESDSFGYSAALAGGGALPAWLSFNAASGTFSGTPGVGTAGLYVLQITATDAFGAAGVTTFALTVIDGAAIEGTEFNDTLNGTIQGNLINARGGNDIVNAGPGADVINGDAGNDTLNGEAGDDTINGGIDADTLNGGDGNDILNGNAGGDSMIGGNGNDTLDGGSDNDGMQGDAGNDTLTGGAGSDFLSGGSGADTLNGGEGNDNLTDSGDGSTNSLLGEAGIDTLSFTNFNPGNTTLDGGADNDTFSVTGRGGTVTIITGTGLDTITLLSVTNGNTAIVVTDFTPGAGGDKLDLNATLALLTGWDGSTNPFHATVGYLSLVQSGADTELRWDQNGLASGGLSGTLVRFQNTTVTAFTSANFTPAYSPDGTAPVGQTITGTINGETLTGTIGDDIINAGAGDDTVNAGPGADLINGEGGRDVLNGEAGDDTINGGPEDDNVGGLNGGDGNDIINGNAGIDRLVGGNGNDTLDGGTENDTLQGDAGNDTLTGGLGSDSLNGGNGADTLNGGDGNDSLTDSGDGNPNTLLGEAGTDTFNFSNSGGNTTLDGGADNDTFLIRGRSGSLTITTGTGSDTIRLSEASSGGITILVTDFMPGAGGDVFDLNYTTVNQSILQQLAGWDGSSNPFGAGYLRLVQVGPDTELQWDANGPVTGGSTYAPLARFQNTSVASFTSANFSPAYNPDGSGINGQTVNGTSGADTLTGTFGDDSIFGGDGTDTLSGLNGNDVLDGGNGSDTLLGGQGMDRLIGGPGADTLTGSGASDTFIFGALDGTADQITDFARGAGGDVLDLNATLATFTGISGDHSNAFTGGYLRFSQSGGNTLVQVDGNGGGDNWVTLVTLTGVTGFSESDTWNYLL